MLGKKIDLHGNTIELTRLIVIGDVHGCWSELRQLLYEVDYDRWRDRVILVGDLVDRGPDSARVVSSAREMGLESVCGNHDNKFVRFRSHELKKLNNSAYKNPMRFNEDKTLTYSFLKDEDHDWLGGLPDSIFIKDLNLLVVHAGVMPKEDPLKQAGNVYRHCRYVSDTDSKLVSLDTTTYARPEGTSFWADVYEGGQNIVHGHHVIDLDTPKITVNKLGSKVFGIDTGCCFGGKLTALIFDDKNNPGSFRFHQVKAKHVYYSR